MFDTIQSGQDSTTSKKSCAREFKPKVSHRLGHSNHLEGALM